MYMKVGDNWYEVSVPAHMLGEALVDELDPEMVKKALGNPRRFDPINKTVNAKSLGSRSSTSLEKNILAAYLQSLKPGADKLAYNRAKKSWQAYSKNMEREFHGLVDRLVKKEFTKNQFIHHSRIMFKAGYEKAYRLGTDASGLSFIQLPSEDIEWLKRARAFDYKFLDKFADDIVAGQGSMAYDDRATMYIDTIDAIFDAGRVDAYPNESTLVYWELSTAENCGDCIDLALNSPYRPDELPTTPRAGGTMCLSNCKCELRIRYQRPEKIELDVKPASNSVIKALGLWIAYQAAKKLAKGGGKEKKSKVTTIGMDDYEDDIDLEDSIQRKVLDWNKLDEMVSALASIRIHEDGIPTFHKVDETRIALDKFEKASKGLPDWLDPFSREVYVWHGIGTVVLDYVHEVRKRGELR